MMEGLSQSEFAKRSGCSPSAVSAAVRRGRLKLLPEGGIDPRLVNSDWRIRAPNKNAAPDRQGRKPGAKLKKPNAEPTTAAAKRAKEYADALFTKEKNLAGLRELEYQTKANALVGVKLVHEIIFDAAHAMRDSWMNWPSRIAAVMAAELGVEPDFMLRLLTRHVHAHLLELGDPNVDFGRRET
jgi:hypothetical protein